MLASTRYKYERGKNGQRLLELQAFLVQRAEQRLDLVNYGLQIVGQLTSDEYYTR